MHDTPIPPRINRGARLFNTILVVALLALLSYPILFPIAPDGKILSASAISKDRELASAATKGPYALFD